MAAQAPLAVRTATRTLRAAHDDGLDRSLWREADAQAQTWNSADLTEVGRHERASSSSSSSRV